MRSEKTSIAKEVQAKLSGASFVLFVAYKGMSVDQFRDLRGRLRQKGSRLQVIKNSTLVHATKGLGWDGVAANLDGPTAVVFGAGDITEISKLIKTFTEENKNMPASRGGRLSAQAISAADVEALAMMPARPVMLAKMVGTVAAPLMQLVGVMNQKVLSLLYVLKAAEQKKSQSN